MNQPNKETTMDITRMELGTLKVEYGRNHSLTLEISLPYFMAEQLNGPMPPDDWDDIITQHLFVSQSAVAEWTARFEFPRLNHEQPSERCKGRKRAGQLSAIPRLGQGKTKSAVRGEPGGWLRGCGLRQLSLSRRSKAMPGIKTRNMAQTGYVGRTKRKDTKRLVSA